jgi:hypothetical protein
MDDFTRALDSRVSQADWDRMAGHAGMPAADLKKQVATALQGLATSPVALQAAAPAAGFKLGAVGKTKSGQCNTQEFEISLFKIIGLSGSLTLCGTSSSDWSAELQACLIVAGAKVWCTTYTFNPHNVSICYDPNVGAAKAHLCFAIQISGNKACLNISGNACVWALWWHCGDFNTTPFCIPLP